MKRPLLVWLISIVMILVGALQFLFGVVFVAQRNDASFQSDSGATSSQLTSIGIALVILGAVSVLLAFGLLRGSRGTRALVGVVEVAQIVGGIWTIAAVDSSRRGSAVGAIIGALIVLYFLFGTDKATAFFTR